MKLTRFILFICVVCIVVPGGLFAKEKIEKDHPLVGIWQIHFYEENASAYKPGPIFIIMDTDGTFRAMTTQKEKVFYAIEGTFSNTSDHTFTIHATQTSIPEYGGESHVEYQFYREEQLLRTKWKPRDSEYEIPGLWVKVRQITPAELSEKSDIEERNSGN